MKLNQFRLIRLVKLNKQQQQQQELIGNSSRFRSVQLAHLLAFKHNVQYLIYDFQLPFGCHDLRHCKCNGNSRSNSNSNDMSTTQAANGVAECDLFLPVA